MTHTEQDADLLDWTASYAPARIESCFVALTAAEIIGAAALVDVAEKDESAGRFREAAYRFIAASRVLPRVSDGPYSFAELKWREGQCFALLPDGDDDDRLAEVFVRGRFFYVLLCSDPRLKANFDRIVELVDLGMALQL